MTVCSVITSDPENQEHLPLFTLLYNENPDGHTVESLQMDIAAEESKLELIHAGNPNAIKEYEKRQIDVDKLTTKIKESEASLMAIAEEISKIRSKWEPELDTLIAKISDAFSFNFEQIGCAGEVNVHKDDDFEQWAIQIKVKFR